MLSLLLVATLTAGAVAAAPTTCERCHVEEGRGPASPHVKAWPSSAHATHEVSCVRCHNGDPAATDPDQAHQSVQPATSRTSSINRTQLPETCGQCHPRQATQFTYGRHGAVLASGAPDAPSCSTCHGSMSARIPEPAALEAACASCHGQGSPGSQYPSEARSLLELLASSRERLAALEHMAPNSADDRARRRLWASLDRATDRTRRAIGAIHALDLVAARSWLGLVRSDLHAIEREGVR